MPETISWTGVRWDQPPVEERWFQPQSPLDAALAQRIVAEARIELGPIAADRPAALQALEQVQAALSGHPAYGPRMKSARGLMVIGLVSTGADLAAERASAVAGLEALNHGPHTPAMAGVLRAAGATLGHIDVAVLRDRVAPLLASDPSVLWERAPDAVRKRVAELEARWKASMKRFEALLDRLELRLGCPGEELQVQRVPPFFRRQLARRLAERYRRPIRIDGELHGAWTLCARGLLEHRDLHMNRARELAAEAPFGPGNRAPLWRVPAAGLTQQRPLKRAHLKADLGPVDLVWWGGRRYLDRLPQATELLAELQITQWQGIERPQLVVRDAR